MGTIKDIYDLAKDGSKFIHHIGAIKRALKTELKLNSKFLSDIERSKVIDNKRRIQIISMLENSELSDLLKYDIPYALICSKKISEELAEELKIKRISGYDFEKLVEQLYLMISYLKKDYENTSLDLNSRLIYIYKYNLALINLLS